MEFIEIDDLKMCDDIRLLYANSFPIEEQVEFSFWWEGTFMTYMNTEQIDSNEFMRYIQLIFPTIM